jgi:hypothetical protein
MKTYSQRYIEVMAACEADNLIPRNLPFDDVRRFINECLEWDDDWDGQWPDPLPQMTK